MGSLKLPLGGSDAGTVVRDAGRLVYDPAIAAARLHDGKTAGGIVLSSVDAAISAIQSATGDVTAAIQAIINIRDFVVPFRATPYAIGKITIPAGRTLYVSPGVRFAYSGGNGFVFTLTGSGSGIVCSGPNGSIFTVECAADNDRVWATRVNTGVSNWRVIGAMGIRCSHISVSGELAYADMVTPKMKAAGDTRAVNQGSNGLVIGGGATFDAAPGNDVSGAAFLGYMDGLKVKDCTYTRCSHGVQWWGGNADINVDGASANERKARDYLIEGCRAYDCSGGGIWGSMGRDVTAIGCKAARCGDLSFDAEGCQDTKFIGCHGEDSTNGNFNTYGYNRGILWEGCTAISTSKARPVCQIYNVGQNQENDDLTWIGGAMICLDTTGPAAFTTASGACRNLTISGAKITNVVLQLTSPAMGNTTVQNNVMVFPFISAAPFSAIEVVAQQSGFGQVTPRISGNLIHHEVFSANQPFGTRAISAKGVDGNIPAFFQIDGNQMLLPTTNGFAPIYLESAGGQPTRFIVRNNMTDSAIQKKDSGAAGAYFIPAGSNVNQLGQDAAVQAV